MIEIDGHDMKQIVDASEGTDKDWAFGLDGDWCVRGVDPWWFGRRYPDGSHDGFQWVPDGHQKLVYNETDCKLNWQYMRLLVDTQKREYAEMQCQDIGRDELQSPMWSLCRCDMTT